jgi:hypothetical protein
MLGTGKSCVPPINTRAVNLASGSRTLKALAAALWHTEYWHVLTFEVEPFAPPGATVRLDDDLTMMTLVVSG